MARPTTIHHHYFFSRKAAVGRVVLAYDCEVVTLTSTTNLEKYDVVQSSNLRFITGGAKLTPITAMQLHTGIEPLDSRTG
ncbi:hypothetical protein TNCV_1873871 [Trichonephila clavipes]|nr:hypothetical protein TNCV_1873871 [Trichonephila clavipes]